MCMSVDLTSATLILAEVKLGICLLREPKDVGANQHCGLLDGKKIQQ